MDEGVLAAVRRFPERRRAIEALAGRRRGASARSASTSRTRRPPWRAGRRRRRRCERRAARSTGASSRISPARSRRRSRRGGTTTDESAARRRGGRPAGSPAPRSSRPPWCSRRSWPPRLARRRRRTSRVEALLRAFPDGMTPEQLDAVLTVMDEGEVRAALRARLLADLQARTGSRRAHPLWVRSSSTCNGSTGLPRPTRPCRRRWPRPSPDRGAKTRRSSRLPSPPRSWPSSQAGPPRCCSCGGRSPTRAGGVLRGRPSAAPPQASSSTPRRWRRSSSACWPPTSSFSQATRQHPSCCSWCCAGRWWPW